MMVSFIILLIAHTARIACADRHTDTHETTTVTIAVHARRGLISQKQHCTELPLLITNNNCIIISHCGFVHASMAQISHTVLSLPPSLPLFLFLSPSPCHMHNNYYGGFPCHMQIIIMVGFLVTCIIIIMVGLFMSLWH